TPSGARIEMVGAVGEYSTVGLRQDVAVGTYDDLHITDIDSDGWPELMAVTTGPSSSVINIWTEDESVWSLDRIINTGATGDLFFGFYDNDFEADLIEVIRGTTTTIKVRSGASGFNDITATVAVALDSTGGQLAIGDRNVDGVIDVFHGDAFGIRVVDIGASTVTSAGSLAVPAGTTMLLADYDGDGREDVHLVSGNSLSIHLGGVPPAGEDPDGWFDNGDSIVWDAGPECVGPEACDSIGYAGPGGQWSLKEVPATVSTRADFFYGNPGDVAFSGDWNCDGIDTPGAYRRSDGYVYLRNANTEGIADAEYFFGNPGDLPLIGDFDGDGCDSVSIYRPSEQRFYIINSLGDGQGGLGAAEYDFLFGNPGDKPFTGDFDGDQIDEVGLHRESSGFIYYRLTLTEGQADAQYFFGDPGDVMLTGDWNGDGTDTVAVYRPGDGNWYLKMANAAGQAEYTIHFHEEDETIQPVVGVFGPLNG
ncbi:MAG: hypothetical protein OEO77_04195, partial [Acidimicrobiia bacterium]|nr:hypothetical protein [Acidimicrobiia bacterium]